MRNIELDQGTLKSTVGLANINNGKSAAAPRGTPELV